MTDAQKTTTAARQRLLLVEDGQSLADMLSEYLHSVGFAVAHVANAHNGLAVAARGDIDAVLLDVMLPDLDGFEVCRRIRAQSDVPILMLTARGDELDRIIGLELGADDYLPKPFNPRELLARLRAILRRAGASPETARVKQFGRLKIDLDARTASIDGRDCTLTGYQFDLLCLLANHPGRVLSRDTLLDGVKGEALEVFDRSIDVHISRIRAAIEEQPKRPRRILTVRGAGYVFARNQDDGLV